MNPKLVVCYICGREFGSMSISIHVPKCLEKWRIENNKLPRNQRRSEPVKPTGTSPTTGTLTRIDIQRQNEAACAAAKDAMLSTCDNCNRRFLPAQLVRHQKACRPGVHTFKKKPVGNVTQPPICQEIPPQKISQRDISLLVTNPSGDLQSSNMNCRPVSSYSGSSLAKPNIRLSAPLHQGTTGSRKPPSSATPHLLFRAFAKSGHICAFCGEEFGNKLIDTHEPQCREKWIQST